MSLKKLARKIAGKKTYTVAAGTVIGAAWGAYTGQMSVAEAAQIAIPAILAATLRNGLPKAQPPG